MNRRQGFTLIEMSIVLVIIGLLVGGVLVGHDLIKSAEVRATITQIEKYNQAVNTFQGKYDAIPGDMNAATAAQFGFTPRSGAPGYGDGNGVLNGNPGCGEPSVFWVDLSTANGLNINLIDSALSLANFTTCPATVSATGIGGYFPAAKMGEGNYIHTFSGGVANYVGYIRSDNRNYYGITGALGIISGTEGALYDVSALSVRQAYDIDNKMDDGLPQSGNVQAGTENGWASGPTYFGNPQFGFGYVFFQGAAPGTAATSSSTTCYDNGGNASNPMQYSLSQNSGNGMNCALSFKFQ